MADEIRMARPTMSSPMQSMEPQGSSKAPWIILALVVIAIVVLGVLFRDKLFGGSAENKNGGTMGTGSEYQAVFLTNGQVYFGKLSGADGTYATMTDIFYLQVGPQQGSQTDPNAPAGTPQQQISLVKLGNELHGPVDEMHINRDHVLFYEDLKTDGQVVQAINGYKANPQGTQPNP
jgi:hypothetical protein